MNLAEQLRIVGQWLDAHTAQSAEVELREGMLAVQCVDERGILHQVQLTPEECARLSQVAAQRHISPFGAIESAWGPGLRAAGRLLQEQALRPLRLWSAAGALWVWVNDHGRLLTRSWGFGDLGEHERAFREQRAPSDPSIPPDPGSAVTSAWERFRALGSQRRPSRASASSTV